ncbi:MAG: T9SS type A sorting domain-containing protein [Bacteroidia bacterium]|nr:T9SS type A sorting domain-containing protein [Bacteroidia bacterium]
MKKIVTSLFCLTLNIALIVAQPGTLDVTFNSTGMVTTTIASGAGVNAIAIQSDGKIVAVGYSITSGKKDFAVARYNSNGTLDATFGSGGKVSTDVAGGNDEARAVAIQADGKIVVAGYAVLGAASDFAVMRYTSAGALDATFGTSGIQYTSISGITDIANAILIVPSNGRIILGGGSNGKFCLIAYKASNGTLDSWASGGKAVTTLSGAASISSLAFQSDGKIVAGGYVQGTNKDFQLVRYTSTGFVDNTFGGSTGVKKDISGDDAVKSVAIQTDGGIIAAGYSGSASQFTLVRFNTNGTVDAGYGTSGVATSTCGSAANGVAVLATGKSVAVGSGSGNGGDFGLSQFNTIGANDNSFGTSGNVTTDFASSSADTAFVIALQTDGKMVVGGVSGSSFALARYIGEVVGINETGLTKMAPVVYPNPIHSNAVIEYTLVKDELLTIGLYDISGKLIASIISNERRLQGLHREQLNFDVSISSGTYIIVLTNGVERRTVKVNKD